MVLLDITMPEMDGRETIEAMRAVRPDVVAVLSRGYDEMEATFRLQGNGMSGFIPKPYLPRTLASKIKELLRQ